MEKAMEEMHATYLGFHWYPREWLSENSDLARKLANRCGYWYFPKYVWTNDTLKSGKNNNFLKIVWENHGVAPAYHKYNLWIKYTTPDGKPVYEQRLSESDNLSWKPGRLTKENYIIQLPLNFTPGEYLMKIGLIYPEEKRAIDLGLSDQLKDGDGFLSLEK
ncbi:MAG: DUF4832 domain-containing protein [Bacteroidales bacterium]|nr:DUF4832 domain-containing protein [Bacteroidales bacterium]